MIFNKLFVLDKGYVALVESSFNSETLNKVRDELFSADPVNDLFLQEQFSRATLVIKCPLFVSRSFGQLQFSIAHAPQAGELEAYIPTPGDIGSGDHETDVAIADDIARTTAALLINPKAYQSDGCDRFISQLVTPISIYVTVVVSGSYNQWCKYCSGDGPGAVKAYRNTIKQILDNEWKHHGEIKKD